MPPHNLHMVRIFPRRWLAMLVALLLAVGSPVQAQAQGYSGDYYYSGSPKFGDFGGFGFPRHQGGGDVFNARVGGGVGLDLGCGSLNIMDYMKATFNVSDIVERGKAAMQTMLAKVVMTYLLSQPYIASAMNMLDGMLNFGFSMFEQSCDLSEIQANVKREALQRCQQNAAGDAAKLVQCQEQADPMKSFLNNTMGDISKALGEFKDDPIGSLQNEFCDPRFARTSGNQDPQCLFLSFAPRFCVRSDLGSGCTGPKNRKPPISAVGITAATRQYSHLTMDKCAEIWDEIRDADPSITPEGMHAIANAAAKMASDDAANMSSGNTSSLHVPLQPSHMLAMTNVSKAMKMFGAESGDTGASEAVLEEYRKSALEDCPEPLRNDPVRMCRYIAKAANVELSKAGKGSINDNIEITDDEKVDAMSFFNVPPDSEEMLKNAGIDVKSATTMMYETFSCQANGRSGFNENVHLTSPAVQVAVATGDQIMINGRLQDTDWSTTARWMGQSISCGSVEKIFKFWVGKIADTRSEVLMKNEIETVKRTATDVNSGNQSSTSGDKISVETAKADIEETFARASGYFVRVLEANRLACGKFLGREQP